MKTTLVFFNTFKQLSLQKMLQVLGLFIRQPVFFVLAVYASFKAYRIAQKKYPTTAGTNGKGNAFRHAFWNCLVLMYCCKVSSPQKALAFCETFTNLHEELFPNQPLEKAMDLHNNEVGRNYFMSLLQGIHRQFFETSFFVEELKVKANNARLITGLEEDFGDGLVYVPDNKY
ncbi:DUF6973 domain-containing protein [Riemerella anatipestifer]|uniref:DUF6973 domain-containing protein n=1 Tax=Riemerella anatipestifer RA-CH-1 TaxID=1228997 RepID=J9R506_RIEAN|nr:hypothetical protein [Riemerella anatipestifer]AFR35558.1 hypothetical protein B739_0958 [Riemerella anatipestifer RA-CH-1]AIH02592.1 hypothetical protein M949_1424 [Riemerella anatipestifer CH3]MCO7331875.1 hypothetical protein [Riemerella anatipestifer]MCO7350762.1 hypothetical protein [Riemerella anatipestifer]MCU7583307.1 hypothetical protein [Riemerella anatipestifer]